MDGREMDGQARSTPYRPATAKSMALRYLPPDRLVASASHNVFATRTVVLVKVGIWGPGRAVSGMAEAIRTPGSSSEALRKGELQQRGTYHV